MGWKVEVVMVEAETKQGVAGWEEVVRPQEGEEMPQEGETQQVGVVMIQTLERLVVTLRCIQVLLQWAQANPDMCSRKCQANSQSPVCNIACKEMCHSE